MRSLLFWASLLVFFGFGNNLVAVGLLLIAVLLTLRTKRVRNLWQGRISRRGLEDAKNRRKMSVKNRELVSLHKGLTEEIIHSKRFGQILDANLQFLQPLSEHDARHFLEEAATLTINGNGNSLLANLILKILPSATEMEIDALAETAIRKVHAAITQTRAERLECSWYIWRTCQDERVRPSHARLEGVVCSFMEPPHPELLIGEPDLGAYNPGESRECRCYAETMIDPDFEDWPKRAIQNGKLVSLGLREFKSLSREKIW